MITYNDISDVSREKLEEVHHQLIIERMKLDKYFSVFLDKHEESMYNDDCDPAIWAEYKSHLQEYSDLAKFIRVTEIKLKQL